MTSLRRFGLQACIRGIALLAILCGASSPAGAGGFGAYSGGNYAIIDATLLYEGLSIDLDGGSGAGWQLGAFWDLPLHDGVALRAGLAWASYRSSADAVESGSEDLGALGRYDWSARVRGDNRASVLSLPVDLVLRPLGARSRWFVSLGGTLLTPREARLVGEGELEIYQDEERLQTLRQAYDVDYDSNMKDFVGLIGAGLGREFTLFGVSAFTWLRYERSASDWSDSAGYAVGVQGLTLLLGAEL